VEGKQQEIDYLNAVRKFLGKKCASKEEEDRVKRRKIKQAAEESDGEEEENLFSDVEETGELDGDDEAEQAIGDAEGSNNGGVDDDDDDDDAGSDSGFLGNGYPCAVAPGTITGI
jgi:hypothetical protein